MKRADIEKAERLSKYLKSLQEMELQLRAMPRFLNPHRTECMKLIDNEMQELKRELTALGIND